jgi:hypothetical protein
VALFQILHLVSPTPRVSTGRGIRSMRGFRCRKTERVGASSGSRVKKIPFQTQSRFLSTAAIDSELSPRRRARPRRLMHLAHRLDSVEDDPARARRRHPEGHRGEDRHQARDETLRTPAPFRERRGHVRLPPRDAELVGEFRERDRVVNRRCSGPTGLRSRALRRRSGWS